MEAPEYKAMENYTQEQLLNEAADRLADILFEQIVDGKKDSGVSTED